MTNKDYTHLTLVVDKSGSMTSMAQGATEGINDILLEQTKEFGKFTFSLVEFSSKSEVLARMSEEPLSYRLRPDGNTALYDAIGLAAEITREDIAQLAGEEQPETVIFIIVTDGHENASQDYSAADVQKIIAEGRTAGWRFQFMGAEESAYEADRLGADRTSFNRNARGMKSAYRTMNQEMKELRLMEMEAKRNFSFRSEIDDDFSDNYDADKDSM